MSRRDIRFIKGQVIEGKIVSEIFRDFAKTEYLIRFTDGTERVFKFKNNG